MSFVNQDGRPWDLSAAWFDALSGGRLNMKMIREAPRAMKLPVRKSHQLIDERTKEVGCPFNPCILVIHDQLLVNIRVCNIDSAPAHQSQNLFGLWDGDKIHGGYLVDAASKGKYIYGFEDLRLFTLNGTPMAIAAVSTHTEQGSPRTRQALLTLNGELTEIIRVSPIPSDRHEKNWMPVIIPPSDYDGPETLKLIYAVDPLVVLTFKEDKWVVDPPIAGVKEVNSVTRGGSQLIPYEDGWLAVVHQIHHTGRPVYVHRFAKFNKELTDVKLGGPFYMRHVGIEFVAGIQFYRGEYVLSYGVVDREAWLSFVSPETIEASLEATDAPEVIPGTGSLTPGAAGKVPVPVFAKGKAIIRNEAPPKAEPWPEGYNPMLDFPPPIKK